MIYKHLAVLRPGQDLRFPALRVRRRILASCYYKPEQDLFREALSYQNPELRQ